MDTLEMHDKIDFMMELGRAYHSYGASTERLEGAMGKVANKLGLHLEIFSTPTTIIAHFQDQGVGGQMGGKEVQRLLRMFPGDIHLEKLVEVDEVADLVVDDGRIGVVEGKKRIIEITQRPSRYGKGIMIISHGVISAAVGLTFADSSWREIIVTMFLGLLMGVLGSLMCGTARTRQVFEVVGALSVAFVASWCKFFLPSFRHDLVILSSIITLLPGLTFTLAMIELSTQELISGTARLMSAMSSFLKLAFGVALGTGLVASFSGITIIESFRDVKAPIPTPLFPDWIRLFLAPCLASFCFVPIFRAHPRDRYSVVVAAFMGHLLGQWGQYYLGPQMGVFLAGLLVAVFSHAHSRLFKRPVSTTLLPGMILIVPGMLGYRGIHYLFQSEIMTTMDWVFRMVVIGVSLVAGLLCGSALFPAKRFL